jgi:hypothetical protein
LTSCDVENGRVQISLRRRGEEVSKGTDFLSAGENECFFVFLTLLGLDTQDSMILLDEPELHIAEYCRPAFFSELYGLTRARGCQVIIATHSLFALLEEEPAKFLVVGRTTAPGGTFNYSCGENPEYSLSLFKAYWRTGTLFLATAGSARPFRALAAAAYNSLKQLGREHPIPVALLVGAMGSAFVALASDLANFINLQTAQQHIYLIRLVVAFGVLIAIATGLLFWAFRRRRK